MTNDFSKSIEQRLVAGGYHDAQTIIDRYLAAGWRVVPGTLQMANDKSGYLTLVAVVEKEKK